MYYVLSPASPSPHLHSPRLAFIQQDWLCSYQGFFFTYFLQLKLDHFKFMMTLQLHTHGTNTKECKIRLLVRHRKDLVDR